MRFPLRDGRVNILRNCAAGVAADQCVTSVPCSGHAIVLTPCRSSRCARELYRELAQELSLREGNERSMDQSRLTMGHVLAGSLSKRGNGLRSCGLSERGKRLKVCRTM